MMTSASVAPFTTKITDVAHLAASTTHDLAGSTTLDLAASTTDDRPATTNQVAITIVSLPCHPCGCDFESSDAAIKAVDDFAALHGYAVVCKRTRKIDGELHSVVLACDRHGNLRNNWKLTDESRKKQFARSRRCDCPMEVLLRINTDGKWPVEYNGK